MTQAKVSIYIDDVRDPPEDWLLARTPQEARELIRKHKGNIYAISFDNDLGEGQQEGRNIFNWLEYKVMVEKFPLPDTLVVHSANPVAEEYMHRGIANLIKMVDERNRQ